MCHIEQCSSFPSGDAGALFQDREISGYRFGDDASDRCIAVLPDIYGCTSFYRGFAAHLAARGAVVDLIRTFEDLGKLAEHTREAAFERRHRLKDRTFVDAFERYARRRGIGGVVGFCIGGLFVYELARRNLPAALVSFYGFPQGLPNQEAVDVPLTYLDTVTTPHLTLFGAEDDLISEEVQTRLAGIGQRQPACQVRVFTGSGHGFLTDLDGADAGRRDNAAKALALCEEALFATARTAA
ncbi:dienelactone hydrolase family protein [Sphingopyxis sp. DBS4]|uniref:dienelactone hydrolase family protein n=1 Tax=Sphingopyxis sp. DBS4 TaxID=2968500 RepID=UPI00214CB17A|nr:dienelactone hydrolase family protein [Sphingopyxis sp. DBS4]